MLPFEELEPALQLNSAANVRSHVLRGTGLQQGRGDVMRVQEDVREVGRVALQLSAHRPPHLPGCCGLLEGSLIGLMSRSTYMSR